MRKTRRCAVSLPFLRCWRKCKTMPVPCTRLSVRAPGEHQHIDWEQHKKTNEFYVLCSFPTIELLKLYTKLCSHVSIVQIKCAERKGFAFTPQEILWTTSVHKSVGEHTCKKQEAVGNATQEPQRWAHALLKPAKSAYIGRSSHFGSADVDVRHMRGIMGCETTTRQSSHSPASERCFAWRSAFFGISSIHSLQAQRSLVCSCRCVQCSLCFFCFFFPFQRPIGSPAPRFRLYHLQSIIQDTDACIKLNAKSKGICAPKWI